MKADSVSVHLTCNAILQKHNSSFISLSSIFSVLKLAFFWIQCYNVTHHVLISLHNLVIFSDWWYQELQYSWWSEYHQNLHKCQSWLLTTFQHLICISIDNTILDSSLYFALLFHLACAHCHFFHWCFLKI